MYFFFLSLSYYRLLLTLIRVVMSLDPPVLYIEQLDHSRIIQGYYTLQVPIDISILNKELLYLEDAINKFNDTCFQIREFTTDLKCSHIIDNQKVTINRLVTTLNFIKSFFNKKMTKRSWAFWNDMDSNDRNRINWNFNTIRKNEEAIKNSIEHQSAVLNQMYDFMNSSVIEINDKTKWILKNFNVIKIEMIRSINITNNMKHVIYLESILTELNYWIINLANTIKNKQQTILDVLLSEKNNIHTLLDIISPNIFESYNFKNIPDQLYFPTRMDGRVDSRIFSLIKYNYQILNSNEILLSFKIPLVKKKILLTKRISITPSLKNFIVSIIKIDEDVILHEENSTWGYVWNFENFKNCKKLQDTRLCDISSAEINLLNSNKCITDLLFFNKTENCEIKHFKINHDIWFSTSEQNFWRYLTPNKTTITIHHASNITKINIIGSGEFKISPNMSISTNNIKLEYFETVQNPNIIKYDTNYEINKFLAEDWVTESLPLLNGSGKIYSIINNKKLFDIGVDINQIINHKTMLQNIEFTPYNYPWWFSSIGLISITSIIILLLWCFKGKISCCTKNTIRIDEQGNVNGFDTELENKNKHNWFKTIKNRTGHNTLKKKNVIENEGFLVDSETNHSKEETMKSLDTDLSTSINLY